MTEVLKLYFYYYKVVQDLSRIEVELLLYLDEVGDKVFYNSKRSKDEFHAWAKSMFGSEYINYDATDRWFSKLVTKGWLEKVGRGECMLKKKVVNPFNEDGFTIDAFDDIALINNR